MPKIPASSSKRATKATTYKSVATTSAQLAAQQAPIPGVFRLTKSAVRILAENWRVFLGIALIYAALNVLLIQGLHASSNIGDIKHTLDQVPTNGVGRIANGVSLVTTLMGASGTNVSPTAGSYQFILALVVSLAVVWSLREVYAKHQIGLRDGFYRGMYPLVPVLLVLLMVVVQLLPFAVGAILYGTITANAIATNAAQQLVFLMLFLGLGVASLYLLSSSLFALYIVALPNMTPVAAFRSARDLVAHRRWTIMRKLFFLPVLLLLACLVLLLPFVLFLTPAAPWIFTLVAAVLLVFTNTYMYTLYRSLL